MTHIQGVTCTPEAFLYCERLCRLAYGLPSSPWFCNGIIITGAEWPPPADCWPGYGPRQHTVTAPTAMTALVIAITEGQRITSLRKRRCYPRSVQSTPSAPVRSLLVRPARSWLTSCESRPKPFQRQQQSRCSVRSAFAWLVKTVEPGLREDDNTITVMGAQQKGGRTNLLPPLARPSRFPFSPPCYPALHP